MDDDEKIILKLESLYLNGGKPLVNDRVAKTINISAALWRKLETEYGNRARSDLIEGEMIKRLRQDNKLPELSGTDKVSSNGKVDYYANVPAGGKQALPDHVLDSPFRKNPKNPEALIKPKGKPKK